MHKVIRAFALPGSQKNYEIELELYDTLKELWKNETEVSIVQAFNEYLTRRTLAKHRQSV